MPLTAQNIGGYYFPVEAAATGSGLTFPHLVAGRIISSGADLLLAPLLRQSTYGANAKLPTLIPSPAELIQYYTMSNIDKPLLLEWLAAHGIASPGDSVGQGDLWGQIIDRATAQPPLEMLLRLLYREQYSPAMLRWLIQLYGFKDKDASSIMIGGQPWPWSPDQIRILRAVYNLRTDLAGAGLDVAEPAKNYQKWLQSCGMHLDTDREKFEALIQPPGYGECVEARNRGIIDQATFQEWVTLGGTTDANAFRALDALRATLPGSGELLGFSVRGAFDKHMSEQLGLDHEFRDSAEFQIWSQRTGLIGGPALSDDELDQGMRAGDITPDQAARIQAHRDQSLQSWTQAMWRSHWVLPAPAQAFEMFRRLRPADPTRPTVGGKLQPRMPVVPGSQSETHPAGIPIPPVDFHDVNLIQRAHADLPRFRAALAGLSFTLPRIFDIRRVAEFSLRDGSFQDRAIGLPCIDIDGNTLPERIDAPTDSDRRRYLRAWIREQYLDRGQSPENAATSAVLAIAQAERIVSQEDRAAEREWERRFQRVNERAYATGRITQEQYAALVFPDNFLGDRKRWELRILDEERGQRNFDANIRAIRTEFLDGVVNAVQATQMLRQNGMSDQAIADNMHAWPLRKTMFRTLAKTADVLKWYNDLLIDQGTALDRLEALGWTHGDALLELQLPPPKTSRRGLKGSGRLPANSQPSLNGSGS